MRLNKSEWLVLFLGDIFLFVFSVVLALCIRLHQIPEIEIIKEHILSFGTIIIFWTVIFYIFGLYDKQTRIIKNKIPKTLSQAFMFNTVVALGYFYAVPGLRISPKLTLVLFIGFSFVCIAVWRIFLFQLIGGRIKEEAILIGSGAEVEELFTEVNNNTRYNLKFSAVYNPQTLSHDEINKKVSSAVLSGVKTIVVDFTDSKIQAILPELYNVLFKHVTFIDMHQIYEDLFDRIPVSLVSYEWVLNNTSIKKGDIYDGIKRIFDICFGIIVFLVTLPLYILVFVLIKLDDKGDVFFTQERIGRFNKKIKIIKFRTMTMEANGDVMWVTDEKKRANRTSRISRVGKFLRVSRIDEIPQLINVIKGDLTLVGPRPEVPDLVTYYEQHIAYYGVRHLITPGLAGWAQIHHEVPPHSVEETKVKLAYDLFYIRNRSFLLDIKIVLKTIKTILSLSGI